MEKNAKEQHIGLGAFFNILVGSDLVYNAGNDYKSIAHREKGNGNKSVVEKYFKEARRL